MLKISMKFSHVWVNSKDKASLENRRSVKNLGRPEPLGIRPHRTLDVSGSAVLQVLELPEVRGRRRAEEDGAPLRAQRCSLHHTPAHVCVAPTGAGGGTWWLWLGGWTRWGMEVSWGGLRGVSAQFYQKTKWQPPPASGSSLWMLFSLSASERGPPCSSVLPTSTFASRSRDGLRCVWSVSPGLVGGAQLPPWVVPSHRSPGCGRSAHSPGAGTSMCPALVMVDKAPSQHEG